MQSKTVPFWVLVNEFTTHRDQLSVKRGTVALWLMHIDVIDTIRYSLRAERTGFIANCPGQVVILGSVWT